MQLTNIKQIEYDILKNHSYKLEIEQIKTHTYWLKIRNTLQEGYYDKICTDKQLFKLLKSCNNSQEQLNTLRKFIKGE